MILSISIENYLSIKDKIVLDFEASSSKRLEDNLYENKNNKKFLKSLAIYGANSSGKSNIIKAINFIVAMIINSGNHKPTEKLNFTPFLLDKYYNKKPTSFEIIFEISETKYKYLFSFNQDKICKESLLYWSESNRENIIFERNNNNNLNKKYNFVKDKNIQEKLSKFTLDNNLYLSKSAQLNYDRTRIVYEYFFNNLIVNINPKWENFTIKKIFNDDNLKNQIIEILNQTDFGGIKDIFIKKQKIIAPEYNFELNPNNSQITYSEKEEENFQVHTVHLDKEGEETLFSLDMESDGSRKFLYMLGPIIDILKNNKILIIDELEMNLHPEISKFIVKMFNSKKNKNAQLVFTTHDTNLLDNDLFRKDQIYFTNKGENNNTEITSLYDYEDIRETTDFEKAYLNGRVGGFPFIDS